MPRSSRLTAYPLANSAQAVTPAPPARAGSFLAPKPPLADASIILSGGGQGPLLSVRAGAPSYRMSDQGERRYYAATATKRWLAARAGFSGPYAARLPIQVRGGGDV